MMTKIPNLKNHEFCFIIGFNELNEFSFFALRKTNLLNPLNPMMVLLYFFINYATFKMYLIII